MRHRLIAVAALAIAMVSSIADAQSTASVTEQAAFTAILLTPAGALPQVVHVQRAMQGTRRGDIAVRFGRYHFDQTPAFNNLGVTGLLYVTKRIQAGGTIGLRSCSDCEGSRMGSLELAATLLHKPAAGDIGGDTDVGVQLSAGLGKANKSDVTAHSFTVSVPLAISLPQAENSSLSLFLSPSLAYGRLTNAAGTFGASRFMIGAGMGYSFAFGLGVHASAHKIIIDDSPTQYGFAMSWLFGGA
jgi:hypothetical protein